VIKQKKIYFCENCGQVIESLRDSRGVIKSCGSKMIELEPNITGDSEEIHVPVIKREGINVTVSVGETPHPMESDHFILFIEVLAGDKVLRHDFKEGDEKAEASFLVEEGVPVKVRVYCDIDGLWESN